MNSKKRYYYILVDAIYDNIREKRDFIIEVDKFISPSNLLLALKDDDETITSVQILNQFEVDKSEIEGRILLNAFSLLNIYY